VCARDEEDAMAKEVRMKIQNFLGSSGKGNTTKAKAKAKQKQIDRDIVIRQRDGDSKERRDQADKCTQKTMGRVEWIG
jgi:hypothetical protein